MVLIGGGLGLFAAPNMASVMARLPAHRQGVAGSLSLLTRTAGIVTGVAAWSAVFDHLERTRSYSDAFALTSYLAAAVLAATLLISVAQLGLTRRTQ